MFRINHNEAIELEHQVRRLYDCDRGGVSGMVDADYFEGHPIQAAVLVVSYIYANHRESGPYQFDEFLNNVLSFRGWHSEWNSDLQVHDSFLFSFLFPVLKIGFVHFVHDAVHILRGQLTAGK